MGSHILDSQDILHKLFKLGYFGVKKWPQVVGLKGAALEEAVRAFQHFHGLTPDGEVGPKTASAMNRRRCGLPDYQMRLKDEVCAWPMKNVGYYTELQLPGMSDADAAKAYDTAAAQWMAICGVQLSRVDVNHANIFARGGAGPRDGLDGRGGTLAWSELPCDATPTSTMRQVFDQAEDWNYAFAVAVICHEMGHALGLPHLAKGSLMAPFYDPNTTKPQAGDIREMVLRYGEPAATPPSPPPGPSPDPAPPTSGAVDVSGVLMINGMPYVLQPR